MPGCAVALEDFRVEGTRELFMRNVALSLKVREELEKEVHLFLGAKWRCDNGAPLFSGQPHA